MSHYRNTCPGCNGVSQCRCPSNNKVETTNLCKECLDAKVSKIVKEDAVAGSVGAGAVAGFRGRMFMKVKRMKNVANPLKVQKIDYKRSGLPESRNLKSFAAYLAEGADLEAADVIAKLARNAEVSDDLEGDDLAVFGMEDEDGNVTKVYVPREQSTEFEAALADALRGTKEMEEQEIAGVLFDLKDKFKIVDVKWPTFQEDEQQAPAGQAAGAQPQGAPAGAAPAPGSDPNNPPAAVTPGAPGAEGDPSLDGATPDGSTDPDAALDGGMPPAGGGDSSVDMIAQVLDMLRSDAEARKAEAEAKTAQARAEEAEAAGKVAAIKLSGEEQVMDAEAFFKGQKDEQKEADRIKMLAKYRQETKLSQDTAVPAPAPTGGANPEEEQVSALRKTLLSILNRG